MGGGPGGRFFFAGRAGTEGGPDFLPGIGGGPDEDLSPGIGGGPLDGFDGAGFGGGLGDESVAGRSTLPPDGGSTMPLSSSTNNSPDSILSVQADISSSVVPDDRSSSSVTFLSMLGTSADTRRRPLAAYLNFTFTGVAAGNPGGRSRTTHLPMDVELFPDASPPSMTLTATLDWPSS